MTAVVKVYIFASMAICMSNYRFFMAESSILMLFQRNIILGGHLTTILTSKVMTAVVKVYIFASMAICMSNYRFFMAESSILMSIQRNIILGGHLTAMLTPKVMTAVVKVYILANMAICMSNYRFLVAESSILMFLHRNIMLGGHLTTILTSKVMTAMVKVNNFASIAICMSNYRFFMAESSILMLFQRNIMLGGHLNTIVTSKVLTRVVNFKIFARRAIYMSNIRFFNMESSNTILFQRNN